MITARRALARRASRTALRTMAWHQVLKAERASKPAMARAIRMQTSWAMSSASVASPQLRQAMR
jgi:hypothetical protein